MFKSNKNIVRLNGFGFILFGFAIKPENIFKSQVDMRTLVAVIVLLVVTAAALSVYNGIQQKHEKILKSKLSSR